MLLSVGQTVQAYDPGTGLMVRATVVYPRLWRMLPRAGCGRGVLGGGRRGLHPRGDTVASGRRGGVGRRHPGRRGVSARGGARSAASVYGNQHVGVVDQVVGVVDQVADANLSPPATWQPGLFGGPGAESVAVQRELFGGG